MLSMLTQLISDRDEFQPSSDSQMQALSSQLLVFVEGILLFLNPVWFQEQEVISPANNLFRPYEHTLSNLSQIVKEDSQPSLLRSSS